MRSINLLKNSTLLQGHGVALPLWPLPPCARHPSLVTPCMNDGGLTSRQSKRLEMIVLMGFRLFRRHCFRKSSLKCLYFRMFGATGCPDCVCCSHLCCFPPCRASLFLGRSFRLPCGPPGAEFVTSCLSCCCGSTCGDKPAGARRLRHLSEQQFNIFISHGNSKVFNSSTHVRLRRSMQ